MGKRKLQEGTRQEYSWRERILALWPLLIPLVVILPGINDFPYPGSGSPYSDIVVTHYPNALFLRNALLHYGSVPLWDPHILSGYPFFANPLSGLWYPPGWLALLLPLPFGFNLLVIGHLLFGGIGTYRLLNDRGYTHRAALVGALAFEGMPKLFAHYGAGHLTLIYALSWTPWLLWSIDQANRLQGSTRIKIWWAYGRSAIIYALLLLADVRWSAFAGLLWISYGAYLFYGQKTVDTGVSKLRRIAGSFSAIMVPGLWAGLISAVLLLPLGQYASLSTRDLMSAQDIQAVSLPLGRLLGLVFPDFGGYHEWIVYPGVVVLGLSIAAILASRRVKDVRFWLAVAITGLLLALGGKGGLAEVWANIPGLSWLRIPGRALFASGIAWAILAATGTEALLGELPELASRRIKLVLAGLTGFALLLAFGVWLMVGTLAMSLAWGGGVLFITVRWIGGRLGGRSTSQSWFLLATILMLFDLLGFNYLAYIKHSPESVFKEQAALTSYLENQSGLWRIYSPSYSLPQQVAAQAGFELADGVDPLQLKTYVAYMETASGVSYDSYSVTLPPLEDGEPETANREAIPDPEALGRLNVRYVAAAYPLQVDGLKLIDRFEGSYLYENISVRPRAWLETISAGDAPKERPVEIIDREPNVIRLVAEGPARLVLAEVAYPGWKVQVDGEPAELVIEYGLLRAVDLPSGEHEVSFVFRPGLFYVGLAASGLGLVLLGLVVYLNSRQAHPLH